MRTTAWAAAAVGAMLLVGCTGNPPPTTTPSGPPAAGCYDSYVDTADLSYSGTPNVVGNLTLWDSGDGSCTGVRPNRYSYTLVYSTDGAVVAAFCTANGLQAPQPLDAREPTYDFRLDGVTIGPDAYLCLGPAV